MRFNNAVHAHDGIEEEKVAAAKLHHPLTKPKTVATLEIVVGELLSTVMRGGGHRGVLGTILSYV